MKFRWTLQETDKLKEFWPHFGTYHIAEVLGFSRRRVKGKVDGLKLTMLPKVERSCISCSTGKQFSRYAGLYCQECHLGRRRHRRLSRQPALEEWIRLAVNTARYRSKETCDLTPEYMCEQ